MDLPFKFGQKVYADGDMNCAMIAAGFLYQAEGSIFVQCKYFANGQHVEVFVEAWRLKSKEE